MIPDIDDLLALSNTTAYCFSPEENGYVRIKRENAGSFHIRFFPANTPNCPLIVILPGYNAVFPDYPFEELTDGFCVLLVSPLGYTEKNTPVTKKKIKGNFPVLFNTAFGKPEHYGDWLLDVLTAIRWVSENTAADCDSIYFYGTSQGGGMSLVMGGILSGRCKAICADEPWLIGFSDFMLQTVISSSAYYYPNEIISYARVSERLKPIDPVSYTDKLTMPKLILSGSKDIDCPPERVYNYYSLLPCPKYYYCFENRIHGYNICSFTMMKDFFKNTKKKL